MIYKSQLLHRGHIDRLNIIFPSKDLIKDVVGENFVVFNDASHWEFLNAESNINFLGFLIPGKTVDLESKNSLGQLVKVGHLLVVYFNVKHDNWLGNRFGFLSLFLGLFYRLFGLLGSIIFSKRIKIVILFLLCFSFFLFFFTFLSVSFGSLLLADPGLKENWAEGVDEEIPVVSVGVGGSIGEILIRFGVLLRSK